MSSRPTAERTNAALSELRRFVVEDGSDMATLVSGLERRAPFDREPDRVVERTIYDTFDWRLHDEGTVLEHEREVPIPPARGGRLPQVARPALVWRAADTGEVLGRIVVDHVPRFATALPDGPIAERGSRPSSRCGRCSRSSPSATSRASCGCSTTRARRRPGC